MVEGAARPAGRRLVRLRHRRAGGQHRRARRRPAPRARPRPAGTSSATASPAARRCGSWPAASATPRSTGRCGCWVSAPACVEPVAADANGRDRRRRPRPRARRRARPGRRSSACRPATSNTGAFDDLGAATAAAHEHGAWVHVDGAFGLWAAASPATRHLVDGHRARRLVGDRRAQVAQRPLRLRLRVLRPPRGPRGRHVVHRRLPDRARRGPGAGAVRLRARVVAASPRLRHVGRAARARPRGRGRPRRAVLRAGPPVRGPARRGRRRHGRQRRRAQPGAGRLRRRRRAPTGSSPRCNASGSAGWAPRRGTASGSCGSRCRTGARPRPTSTGRWPRSSRRTRPRANLANVRQGHPPAQDRHAHGRFAHQRPPRVLAGVLEPVAGQVYFSAECHRNYERLGFSEPGTT